jgi:hypothetical protein
MTINRPTSGLFNLRADGAHPTDQRSRDVAEKVGMSQARAM